MTNEITIAGGGLTGLSLGIALRKRDVPVRIIEAGHYPRHRVCGEFISGVTQETLSNLGISRCFSDAKLHSSLTWFECGRTLLKNQLPAPALGISRYRLDLRLHDLFLESGGIIATGIRAKPEPSEGLVWTAGRRAVNGPWIGLKAHVRVATASDLEMHSGTNGYAGLAGIEDGWTNVCGLFRMDRNLRAKGSALLLAYLEAGGNHKLAAKLQTAEWRDGSFSTVAGFNTGSQPEIPSLLQLGDASEMIPPFTGNGMTMAFESAQLALDPLVSWAQGRKTWQQARDAIRSASIKCFRRRMTAATLAHPLLFQDTGRAVLRSLAAVNILPFRPLLSLVR